MVRLGHTTDRSGWPPFRVPESVKYTNWTCCNPECNSMNTTAATVLSPNCKSCGWKRCARCITRPILATPILSICDLSQVPFRTRGPTVPQGPQGPQGPQVATQVWYCCQCGNGPMIVKATSHCSSCTIRRCSQCTIVTPNKRWGEMYLPR